jgi:NAD(P)-dependent dehydrogenase (short-subunit alcohol dehydrogenase family)
MTPPLDGRVALVTGASSGIGRATALALARDGATVLAAARRREPLEALAAECAGIQPEPADVTDPETAGRLAGRLAAGPGRLDVLVAAAGVNVRGRRFEAVSPEDWEAIVATNLTATFRVVRACLPLLRASAGLVISISSASGRWPDASGPAYQASKAGVIALANAIALEEMEHGVRVSSVLPGLVDTPLLLNRPRPPDRDVLDRALRPEDVADVCRFLAGLDPRVLIPEVVVLPAGLQRIGRPA